MEIIFIEINYENNMMKGGIHASTIWPHTNARHAVVWFLERQEVDDVIHKGLSGGNESSLCYRS